MDFESVPLPEFDQPETSGHGDMQRQEQPEPNEFDKKMQMFEEKFAKLSELESRHRNQKEEFENERNTFLQEKEKYDKWKNLERIKEEDVFKWLDENGYNMETLNDMAIKRGEYEYGAEFRNVKKELGGIKGLFEEFKNQFDSFKEEVSSFRNNQEEKELNSQQQEFISNVKRFVSNNQDKYEMISMYGDDETIINTALEYFKKNGEPIDTEKLCESYNNYLVQKFDNWYNKASETKRARSLQEQRRGPEFKSEFNIFNSGNSEPQRQEQRGPKTITNEFYGSAPPADKNRVLSKQESIEEAAKLIRFIDS